MPLVTTEDAESIAGLAMTTMASEPIRAGQPVFVGPDGTLYLSSASDASRSFVDGFARFDVLVGQTCEIEDRRLTLPDWSRVTGSTLLVPGTRYYLGAQYGRLQPTAPTAAGQAAIRVGLALDGNTLRALSVGGTTQAGTAALLSGLGPPLNSLGIEGQGYVDKQANPRVLYVKTDGVWIVLGALTTISAVDTTASTDLSNPFRSLDPLI